MVLGGADDANDVTLFDSCDVIGGLLLGATGNCNRGLFLLGRLSEAGDDVTGES